MTFREAFRDAKHWQRKVALISLFHHKQLAKYASWKAIDTAIYFGCSIGLVSENLKLSKYSDVVKDCKSRNNALMKLRKQK